MQHGQHGAEILAELMRQVFDLLNTHILAHGGFIAGFAGDSVTAIFKNEINPAKNLRRALAAAMGFQAELSTVASINTIYGKFPISAKTGLAYGSAQWGILRSRDDLRATYYFSGELIDGAALAEHHARPGEIIISNHALEKLPGDIIAIPREECHLIKGILRPLPASQPIHLTEPDRSILRVFFPDILLKPNVPLEFRQVFNLFIQLPEQPVSSLAEFIADLFELQVRYGGLISRLDHGDKGCNILLFWGAPIAYENDILRALNFISDLRNLEKYSFKAGLTYFVACAGFMGSDKREEYTCYGRGVNLAARFMIGASFGDVWLDEGIATRAQTYFEFEYIGDKDFKGFASKQKVFRLLQPKSVANVSYQRVMVGRENELHHLEEFVSPLWKGEFVGGLMVWGEAGIGKSRLINEFRSSALFADRHAKWALCQSNQLLRQSFDPFRYWLSRYFDISTNLDHQENLERFQTRLQTVVNLTIDESLSLELVRTSSFLAALVGLHWNDSLYNQLDAQGKYDNTFIALGTLIKAESLLQPLILFLEDVHYIDEDSRAFLIYLHRSLIAGQQNYPVAIVATSRKEPATQSIDPLIFNDQLDLGAISENEIARLAVAILQKPVTPSLLRLLVRRSEGNPFFAEQIITYLREENRLQDTPAGWQIDPSAPDSALPVDLHAILVARLDQLTREIRDVIQTASIIGREFEIQVLSHMVKEDPDLPIALFEAEKAAIWNSITEFRYIFQHALLRDAAYTMQLQAQREKLHALAVEAIETLYADLIENHYAELAYHAERARLVEKARHYLLLAGDISREAYQNTIAVDYYTRALALTPVGDADSRFILLLNRERALGYQGQPEQQFEDINTLQALAAGMDKEKQAEVGLREIKFLFYSGNYPQAITKSKRVINLARAAKKVDIILQVQSLRAYSMYRQGNFFEAIRSGQKGLLQVRRSGDRKVEAQFLNILGMVFLEIKDLEKAKKYFEACLDIANEVNSLNIKARVLNSLAMLAGNYGDFISAQDYYQQALTLSREIGDRKGEGIILANLGWIAGLLGDYTKANDYTQKTLSISRETGDRFSEAYSLINLGAQTGAWGQHEIALNYARQGLELARTIGDQSGEAWALTYLGHNLLATGRHQEAVEAYQSALSLRERLNQPVLAAEPAAGLARTSLLMGDLQLARQQVSPILVQIDEGGRFEGTDEPQRIYLNCYFVLQAAGHPRSSEILEIGYRVMQQRLANIHDEAIRENFIRDITYNREMMAVWQELFGNPGSH